jgi:hypothetical protein
MKTIHYPPIEKIEPVKQTAGKVTAKVWGDGMLNIHKERRAYDRVQTSMEARFFCGNRYYAGKITDVSEQGMFITTDIRMPIDTSFEIMMLINNQVARMPVTVRRTIESTYRSDNFSSGGMGVELMKSTTQYLSYVSSLKSAA